MPSVTSSRVSAETSFTGRPPSTPPAAFSSSTAISAPRRVLSPVSEANDPMNPMTTGSSAARGACEGTAVAPISAAWTLFSARSIRAMV